MTLTKYSEKLNSIKKIEIGDIVYYEGYLTTGVMFGWGTGKVSKIRNTNGIYSYIIEPFLPNQHEGEVVLYSPSYRNDFMVKIG